MSEEYKLDRSEYKLSDGWVIDKHKVNEVYKNKHINKTLSSQEEVDKFIQKTLKDRKRYLELIKTLSNSELSKIFDDAVLLGLTPKQIKEFTKEEVFEYRLFIDDELTYSSTELREIQSHLAEKLGLNWYNNLTLISECGTINVGSVW